MREMELRLERLEKIVFATSKLSVMEAERRLTRAQQRFDNNEKLLIRGFITERQFAEDRFNLQLAFRERELARNASNSRRISMKIDVLRAENRLRVAKDNFERNSRLRNRGYSSLSDVESARKEVTLAERSLEVAKMRLDAISKPLGNPENKPEKKADRKKPKDSDK